ncbi:hypothetical protein F4809DRAFT_403506 [Biscogniauxia mediterranea]|nr:hypothetical protein F4809DRAFT_403506 [Biscogniauxia mediterranea]
MEAPRTPTTPYRPFWEKLIVTTPTIASAESMEALQNDPVVLEDRSIRKSTKKRGPYHTRLSRDDRVVCQALYKKLNWNLEEIAEKLGFSRHQVQYACSQPLTPNRHRKHRGHIPDEIKEKLHLRFFLPELSPYGEKAITRALVDMGFHRRVRRRRIQLSARTKAQRVAFAEWCLSRWPRPEDWVNNPILWSDETWAHTNPMWKTWVTIHDCENADEFDLFRTKGHGWMFWGAFAGRTKGPCFIWPKEYGGIDAAGYIAYILPLVGAYANEHPGIIFQQDGC